MFETFPINKTQYKQVKISMHLISGGKMENMYYINAKFWAPGRSLGGWGRECISPGGLKWKDRVS